MEGCSSTLKRDALDHFAVSHFPRSRMSKEVPSACLNINAAVEQLGERKNMMV